MSGEIPFVDLGAQHAEVAQEVEKRFGRIMDRTDFVLGDEVSQFEAAFAEYCGAREAIGVANGSDALVLALRALGIGPGDEVITAANTFVATVEAIAHAGATPVLVDCDPDMYTLDVTQLDDAVSRRTRAVIPVHLYGRIAAMEAIQAWATERGVAVVEDAAQAHGAEYRRRRPGSWSDLACYSFYPAKNLGAYGDAGAVTTDDAMLGQRVRILRDHGSPTKYTHRLVGYNSRLDSLQAAVLNAKLPRLDAWNDRRRDRAADYADALGKGLPITLPPEDREERMSSYHLYVIRLEQGDRDAFRSHLDEEGIGTGIHYPTPVHLTEAFSDLGYVRGDFPVAETLAERIVSLPIHPHLTTGDVDRIASACTGFFA